MGRAIVRDPQVFLFDEPLSNLDAKLRVQMRTEIKELHQRLRTTSIYVTHDQIEAMTMADRIVVMRDGVGRAERRPARALRPSGQHVRRGLHRLAGDEHGAGHARASTAARDGRVRSGVHAAAAVARAAPDARSVLTACARSIALAERRGCGRRSSSSSRPAPTPALFAASTARSSRRSCATA
jgi:ABC-type sulfate/molybdate transport systems ATPase subunit